MIKIIEYKNINGNSDEEKTNILYQDMVNTYNSCTGENKDRSFAENNLVIKDNNPVSNVYYKYACMYYEYMQFKRGIFKCSHVGYDSQTGRVDQISFVFTGKIH